MGAYEMIKDVMSIAQKADNVELMRSLVALQSQVLDLTEENRALKSRLTTQEQLVFRRNAYWKQDPEDGPFCSKCWDVTATLVRLHRQTGYSPKCPACGTFAPDPDRRPVPISF